MKIAGHTTACLIFLICAFATSNDLNIQYIFPQPDAQLVSPDATIILKTKKRITGDYGLNLFGKKCGQCAGKVKLLNDAHTILFQPDQPFVLGDTIAVTFKKDPQPLFTFQFFVTTNDMNQARLFQFDREDNWQQERVSIDLDEQNRGMNRINGMPVPSDFPQISVSQYGKTAPGRIFFGSTFTDIGNYIAIVENDGTPYFYRRYQAESRGSGEFKVQPTGVLTAYLFWPRFYIALDNHYVEIDTFSCKHGYDTDAHELVLLPNGHALLIALDYQKIDMSQVVQGGNKNATVLGNHVQELDENKDVVFEWRSWDHYNIADAVHENLRSSNIDYVHMNSIAVDYDGHLIVSARHLNEITKINHDTGEIIWRLGGEHNQFEFLNQEYQFSYQHFARPVEGKPNQYTLFDNGNFRFPQFTRAVQYLLDPEKRTAEKVWEFRYVPDRYSSMMGNVQRLSNGNTFINWSAWPPLFACEVNEQGDVLLEIQALGSSSNRVRRYEWQGVAEQPYLIAESHSDGLALFFNKFGDEYVDYYKIYGDTLEQPGQLLATSTRPFLFLTELTNNRQWIFQVTAVDSSGLESAFSNSDTVFVRFREPGQNILLNGDFSQGKRYWTLQQSGEAVAEGAVNGQGIYSISVQNSSSQASDVQLRQENIELVYGLKYIFEFDACSDSTRYIEAKICKKTELFDNYSKTGPLKLGAKLKHYAYEFEMENATDFESSVVFNCGQSTGDVYLDNVSLKKVIASKIKRAEIQPTEFKLYQNYPNPFNPNTTICFELEKEVFVSLSIYDTMGRLVTKLIDEQKSKGIYRFEWDGKNDLGKQAANGVYFCDLRAGDFKKTLKMTLLK